jgi:hypothetical protein
LIEKKLTVVSKSRKTKRGNQVPFARKVRVFRPKGLFKQLCDFHIECIALITGLDLYNKVEMENYENQEVFNEIQKSTFNEKKKVTGTIADSNLKNARKSMEKILPILNEFVDSELQTNKSKSAKKMEEFKSATDAINDVNPKNLAPIFYKGGEYSFFLDMINIISTNLLAWTKIEAKNCHNLSKELNDKIMNEFKNSILKTDDLEQLLKALHEHARQKSISEDRLFKST